LTGGFFWLRGEIQFDSEIAPLAPAEMKIEPSALQERNGGRIIFLRLEMAKLAVVSGAAGRRFPRRQPSVAVNLTIRQTEIVRNTRFFCIFYFSVQLICAKDGATKD
jgi:hypothetical protein